MKSPLFTKLRMRLRRQYNDESAEDDSDIPLVEEMLRSYYGIKYTTIPPDPKFINIDKLTSMRERLMSPYSYRWQGLEANMEIAEVLFGGRRCRNNNFARLIYHSVLENKDGHSPPFSRSPIRWTESDGYFKKYYITVAISSVRRYINDLGDAEHLLRSIFPSFGYTMTYDDRGRRIRLEHGSEVGPWFDGRPAALNLVIATLERLERYPNDVPHWCEP